MKQSVVQSSILSVALAFFAMLFGSGNIVYPLSLGRDTGSMALYAMVGFFITAVFVPLLGIVAMILYDGNYERFFSTIGALPGKITIFFCMLLVGPFCIIPRSVSLAHGALEWLFPWLTRFLFSIIAVAIIYGLTSRQSGLLNILGKVLGPLKLLLLSSLIVKGFFVIASPASCALTAHEALSQGIFEGYGTLDLLGAFFFTNMILIGLKRTNAVHQTIYSMALQGGLLGCLLLGAVYAGFVIVSSFQSVLCQGIAKEQLLSTLAAQLLGPIGGGLASITIAVACLTTAIALTTVFADYLSKDFSTYFFNSSISYHHALYLTLMITLIFSNYGFQPIMDAVHPVIKILYPALIVLALANILSKIAFIHLSKGAFYTTLFITLLIQYGSHVRNLIYALCA